MTDLRPAPGDTVTDPSNGRNSIVAVRGPRLLLKDSDGFVFILARYRLQRGWVLCRREGRPRRDREPRVFTPRREGVGPEFRERARDRRDDRRRRAA